jgi:hypothetical protein
MRNFFRNINFSFPPQTENEGRKVVSSMPDRQHKCFFVGAPEITERADNSRGERIFRGDVWWSVENGQSRANGGFARAVLWRRADCLGVHVLAVFADHTLGGISETQNGAIGGVVGVHDDEDTSAGFTADKSTNRPNDWVRFG